ncbi:MAG: sialate O-acetylesterase [Planctomycetota bacterium]
MLVSTSVYSDLQLSELFSDHTVLQRDAPVPIWGFGDPGTQLSVSFAGQNVNAVVDETGRWTATLRPLKLNKQPQELVVKSGQTVLTRRDILVGDVWLCGGQSNMNMTFKTPRLPCDMPAFINADKHPTIRHMAVLPRRNKDTAPIGRFHPSQIKQGWTVCNADTALGFTATGFFFAYTLAEELDVPIGLLNITQGNTRIDMWMSPKSAETIADEVPTESLRAVYSKTPFTNYRWQIEPAAGFAIKGAIWYQGEANAKEGDQYMWKMKALISGWREAWGQGDFPFYFVQLPSYENEKGNRTWAPIRDAQRKALSIPNTGMAVLTDAGDTAEDFPINLHPRNKYAVGRRLALWALAKDYGKDNLVYSGPLFQSASPQGNTIAVRFDHVGSGLMAAKKTSSRSNDPPRPVDELKGFMIAGEDKQWAEAAATIQGDTVVLSSDQVDQPIAVRYLYTMNTDHGTLYNKEGLPASPFRTDDWPNKR